MQSISLGLVISINVPIFALLLTVQSMVRIIDSKKYNDNNNNKNQL